MLSPLVKTILASFRATSGSELDLLQYDTKGQLTDADLARLAEQLPELTSLALTNCEKVTDVGVKAVADKLTRLTSLDLTSCYKVTDEGVKAVADKLSGLTSLTLPSGKEATEVGATDGGVPDELPRPGFRIASVTDVGVTDAGVKAVADKLTGLTSLNLTSCLKLTDAGVKAVADKLTGLTSLNLTSCKEVTDTGVKAVADKLTGLTSLNLTSCYRVTDAGVEAVADRLTGLTLIKLTNCRLISEAGVKALADKLTRLTHLDIRGIEAVKIPTELLDNPENAASIRAYYTRGEREGKRQLNEAKLIVVGNEAVGKSALVNYLVENRPSTDSAKTEGVTILDRINVAKWDVEKSTTGEDPLRLNVWDFGGQEVLYETHRFFLTARSLYLIVLEARRENTGDAETGLYAWMQAVQNRGGEEVPIIVVVNKAEAPHDLRLDEARLQKDYPAIRAFVRTSCRDPNTHPEGGKGIVELRRLIVDVVLKDIPHVRDWLPDSYFQVKETVGRLAREESMLSTARYATICAEAGITNEAEQDTLLALLDQIGVVVKHSEATLLDPNWLTTAVYRILTHAKVVKSGGEFSRDNLGELLADLKNADRYPPRWWPYIADMMVRFYLSFPIPDQPGRYLVPEQLPPNEPELNWDEAGSLRFRYDYDSLHRGLLPRFIVEMHHHLTEKRTAWVSGVVLAIEGCKVLVRADRKNRRVHMFITGPESERRRVLQVIRDAFDRIHKLHPKLTVTSMVPVTVPGKPDAAIEYEQLMEFERQGIQVYAYKGTDKPFSVKNLLDGISTPKSSPSLLISDRDAKSVANYLLAKAAADGTSLTSFHLQQLLYISHGLYLAQFRQALFAQPVLAWPSGPTIQDVYKATQRKAHRRRIWLFWKFQSAPVTRIQSSKEIDDPSIRQFLDQIWDAYRVYTTDQLESMTTAPDTPWGKMTEGMRAEEVNGVLANSDIDEYFTKLIEKRKVAKHEAG